MQALLDEIKLQKSGATDAASNVRAGKLVRAGRVVQGSLNQVGASDLRADAAVVDVTTSQIRGTANASDQLEAVFNLEKKLALDLFTQLGVALSPAERNAIEQRPTRSMQAFLAYSRGLTAEDEGRYDDAGRFFNEAVRIDPSFQSAQQKGQEVRQVTAGTAVTSATVEGSLRGTAEGAVVNAASQGNAPSNTTTTAGLGTTVQTTAGDINPSATSAATGAAAGGGSTVSTPGSKDPVSAGTGSDNPTGTARVTIIIKRP
jgi:tetratricopeptide (TPR) repeat protein